MRKWVGLVVGLLAVGVGAQEATPAAAPAAPPAELLEKPYLCEVTRHLYRWYMDEADVELIRAAMVGWLDDPAAA